MFKGRSIPEKSLLISFLLAMLMVTTGCESARWIQDDMYFNSHDAIREVRAYENSKKHFKNVPLVEREDGSVTVDPKNPEQLIVKSSSYEGSDFSYDNYYDFSYTSRLKRFHQDNTWRYFDPYYTNYYQYSKSKNNFGRSIYTTYCWYGPKSGENYHYGYWAEQNLKPEYTPLYFNSFDNTCYTNKPNRGGFTHIMLNSGLARDVITRPEINFTELRRMQALILTERMLAIKRDAVLDKDMDDEGNMVETKTDIDGNLSANEKKNNVDGVNGGDKNANTVTHTSRRYDGHNTDINIKPVNNNSSSSWSRSGYYSEGSRNNNYEYQGTISGGKGDKNNKKRD